MPPTSMPSARAELTRGLKKARARDWEGAERAFSRAIELSPEGWEAYVNRGNVLQERGDVERAIADFSAAIALHPLHVAPYFNRGNARSLLGDLSGALEDYGSTLAIDSTFVRAYERRGLLRERLGDESGAEEDFSRAIGIAPERGEAYVHRASLRALRGVIDDAIADCQHALSLLAEGKERAQVVRLLGNLEASGREAPPSQVVRRSGSTPPTARPAGLLLDGVARSRSDASSGDVISSVPPEPPPFLREASSPSLFCEPSEEENVVLETLEELGFSAIVAADEEGVHYVMPPDDPKTDVGALAHLVDSGARFIFYLVLPGRVPRARRALAAEFLTRANAGLVSGNFEMDWDTGEVRFKSSVDARGAKLGRTLVRNVVSAAMHTLNGYDAAFVEVARGRLSPKAAIALVE